MNKQRIKAVLKQLIELLDEDEDEKPAPPSEEKRSKAKGEELPPFLDTRRDTKDAGRQRRTQRHPRAHGPAAHRQATGGNQNWLGQVRIFAAHARTVESRVRA